MRKSQSNGHITIIAEIASTHEGQATRAASLVRAAADAGADAVKFQYFLTEDLVGTEHPEYELFRQLELPKEVWRDLFALGHTLGLSVYADVFHVARVTMLMELGCDGFKVHSSDLANALLLNRLGMCGLPVFLSLGGATPRDAWHAVSTLQKHDAVDITLLLGFQAFPTSLSDSKLGQIGWYSREFGLPVGYADHVDGDSAEALRVPLLAAAAGATVLEKHITIGRAAKPEDYEAAIEPDAFAELVRRIRQTEVTLGDGSLTLSEAEHAYNRRMKKYPIAGRDLAPGDVLSADAVKLQRIPGGSRAFAAELQDIVDRRVITSLQAGAMLSHAAVEHRVAALVAVRAKSTRLPEKAFADLEGKPSLVRLIDRLRACTTLDEIVLCTTAHREDDRISDLAREVGVRAFRGSELDVMARFLGAAREVDADIVVRVTGDDILTDPVYLDSAVRHHLAMNAEYTCVQGLPVGLDREIITTRALHWIHCHVLCPEHTEYMTWYLDDPAALRVARLTAETSHCRPDYRLTLDTPQDLELFRWLYRSLGSSDVVFGVAEIVALLDSNPEMAAMGKKSPSKVARSDIDTSLDWRRRG